MNRRFLREIADVMNRLTFVAWDRCVGDEHDLVVYGWIPRGDGRSDFVVLNCELRTDWNGDRAAIGFATSSSTYSAEIARRVYGDAAAEMHRDCERVEHVFGELVEHKVELEPA